MLVCFFCFFFRRIAKQEWNKKDKHSHYLDAYNLAQRAVSRTEEVFHKVCSLFAFNEVLTFFPLNSGKETKFRCNIHTFLDHLLWGFQ